MTVLLLIQSTDYADLMNTGLRILVNDDNDGSELVDNSLMALTEEYDTTFEENFQLAEIFATLMWYVRALLRIRISVIARLMQSADLFSEILGVF